MNFWKHFCTITKHKNLVMIGCFKLGLYKQGILHDMSKYSPTEFLAGCKYYKGYMSPNNAEREDKGYSAAWLHHKGRNKHHWEYWIDYDIAKKAGEEHSGLTGMKMPVKYVCEMFVDRVSASKNYLGDKYNVSCPLDYYKRGMDHCMIHEDTAALLELLLVMLSVKGEKETYSYVKNELLKGKVPYKKDELIAIKDALHVQR